jgi:hypothetical protein
MVMTTNKMFRPDQTEEIGYGVVDIEPAASAKADEAVSTSRFSSQAVDLSMTS